MQPNVDRRDLERKIPLITASDRSDNSKQGLYILKSAHPTDFKVQRRTLQLSSNLYENGRQETVGRSEP